MDLSRAAFKKSSLSHNNGCVEVAVVDGHVAVRDSKRARAGQSAEAPVLVFSAAEWEAFLHLARSGAYDRRG